MYDYYLLFTTLSSLLKYGKKCQTTNRCDFVLFQLLLTNPVTPEDWLGIHRDVVSISGSLSQRLSPYLLRSTDKL